MDIFQEEKPEALDAFLTEYVDPKTTNPRSKVPEYFDDFSTIGKKDYFYPIFLQELTYLGEKVLIRRKSDKIIEEVDDLLSLHTGLVPYIKEVNP